MIRQILNELKENGIVDIKGFTLIFDEVLNLVDITKSTGEYITSYDKYEFLEWLKEVVA